MLDATDFRMRVSALLVPFGEGPFQDAYASQVADILGSIESAARGASDERVTELVDFWIVRFYQNAYRELADSINKSYSHMVGRLVDAGHARANFDMAEQLTTYREYGSFNSLTAQNRP